MAAKIVMDDGGGPVIGSITLDGADVNTPIQLSNQDNTAVSGWRWDILDAPELSPALNPLPAPTFGSTRTITPDVKGETIMVRLTTYLDVARTQLDAIDQKVIRVRFDPPFDWVIPAAQESIEANEIRGWAADVNRILREVQAFMDAGGGGGGGAPQYTVTITDGTGSPTAAFGGVLLCAFATPGGAYVVDLPAIGPGDAGKVAVIKVADNSPAITITPDPADSIEGASTYLLSAAFGAVQLVAFDVGGPGPYGWTIVGSH